MKSPLPQRIAAVTAGALFVMTTTACELFQVGSTTTYAPVIERSQRTSMGVVHMWKEELDSGNLTAVTELMRHSSGRKLLAIERHELADDLDRWKNLIAGKPITQTVADTLSATRHTVTITVDYIRTVQFGAISESGLWYITSVQ